MNTLIIYWATYYGQMFSKHFRWINSLNPKNNAMSRYYSLHYIDEETVVQRDYDVRSYRKGQSQHRNPESLAPQHVLLTTI